ncbi:unnamed protein product [Rotaria magnacalcarata]|uniref:Uncharacterized protein n=2 Tax=Rotaria magnacalcarata TaxID=392030 RepID=A0A815UAT7_9BILA|nr:unnamed protein product [Rotaria magnacalcarata]CAF4114740.1 unnamed protein product [Rotaria magnacalcarata]CAF4354784.1 unnamed protein product [Rotaria magnacalcarata]
MPSPTTGTMMINIDDKRLAIVIAATGEKLMKNWTSCTESDTSQNSIQSIIKTNFYIFDKTYLPSDQSDQATIDPMIIVQKHVLLAARKWYEHHLNIATTLFTIDHLFCAKPIAIYSSISSQQKMVATINYAVRF